MSSDASLYEAKHIEDIEKAKKQLKKDESKRKKYYSDIENKMISEDIRMESMKIFISIVRKYNIEIDDAQLLLEISGDLM